MKVVKLLEESPLFLKRHKYLDLGAQSNSKPKPSIEDPPTLKLKPLPSHLKYAFLEESKKLPVLIFAFLTKIQEEKLLKMLRSHKRAIGWTIADIKGINPFICTHKILMEEEEHKPKVQPQRKLNPSMKEVVRLKSLRYLIQVLSILFLIVLGLVQCK